MMDSILVCFFHSHLKLPALGLLTHLELSFTDATLDTGGSFRPIVMLFELGRDYEEVQWTSENRSQ